MREEEGYMKIPIQFLAGPRERERETKEAPG
jgi:hypothetical protein